MQFADLATSIPGMKVLLQRTSVQVVLLLLVWVGVQLSLYSVLGIRPVLESLKYIGEAQNLLDTGRFSSPRFLFYGFSSAVIALALKIDGGFGLVVMCQLAWNLLALLCYFKALQLLEYRRGAAFATTLLLVFFLPYHNWNFYLYTESFFYSNTLLFFAACLAYIAKKDDCRLLWVQGIFLVFAIFSRPLGILLLPCWFLFLITTAASRKIKVLLTGTTIAATLLTGAVATLIMTNISDWYLLRPMEEGHVICDVPTTERVDLSYLNDRNPIYQLGAYLINHPAHFLRLAVKRIVAFFLLVRPYYSSLHNACLWLANIILYAPILAGIFSLRSSCYRKQEGAIARFSILFFTIAVLVQCDDYHNRFHHALVPAFLFIGVFRLLNGRTVENDIT